MTSELASVVSTETVPIDAVTPHPANARKGDLNRIAASLREHGQYQDLVVQESSKYILAGNHRWRAAKDKLGWTHVSVKWVRCSDAKALQILAVDNRASDGASYDDGALAELLQELDADGALAAAGYATSDLDDLLAKLEEDEPVALPDPERNTRQERRHRH